MLVNSYGVTVIGILHPPPDESGGYAQKTPTECENSIAIMKTYNIMRTARKFFL